MRGDLCWMFFMRFLVLVLPVLLFVFLTYSSSVIPIYHSIVGIKTYGEACYAYRCAPAFPRHNKVALP